MVIVTRENLAIIYFASRYEDAGAYPENKPIYAKKVVNFSSSISLQNLEGKRRNHRGPDIRRFIIQRSQQQMLNQSRLIKIYKQAM